ncbi:MAG: metallophosphoesterase [Acidobacteriia bacterium]|nr:metallophosphoesterase [Terriglobia bacterium]
MRARISLFIAIIQSILLLVHLALYGTFAFFFAPLDPTRRIALRLALAILCFSFVAASLVARQYANWPVRVIYTIAAVWLGLVSFLFLAACLCWLTYLAPLMFGIRMERGTLALLYFGGAFVLALYSILNAARTRVTRLSIRLPNLPPSWRGRTAAVVSDLHLGHVRNRRFLRRIVGMLSQLQPDILFVPGDLFDGTNINEQSLAEPWAAFSAPLGAYFVTGNHEQFSSPDQYLDVVRKSGFRILANEKIEVEGLQIVGVHYLHSTHPDHFRSILKNVGLDPTVASILLIHTPDRMAIAAEEGIALQLSGHTHRGQFFPFTMFVKRVYGRFAYGLNRLENLWVYTSCGAGTWGPPMRLGTTPEIALIRFE